MTDPMGERKSGKAEGQRFDWEELTNLDADAAIHVTPTHQGAISPAPNARPPMPLAISGPAGVSRVRTTLLTVFIIALLGVATLGTISFVRQKQDDGRLSTQVDQLTRAAASAQATVDTLRRDLEATRRDLADARTAADQAETAREALADCLRALDDAARAANISGAAAEAARLKAERMCAQAAQYL